MEGWAPPSDRACARSLVLPSLRGLSRSPPDRSRWARHAGSSPSRLPEVRRMDALPARGLSPRRDGAVRCGVRHPEPLALCHEHPHSALVSPPRWLDMSGARLQRGDRRGIMRPKAMLPRSFATSSSMLRPKPAPWRVTFDLPREAAFAKDALGLMASNDQRCVFSRRRPRTLGCPEIPPERCLPKEAPRPWMPQGVDPRDTTEMVPRMVQGRPRTFPPHAVGIAGTRPPVAPEGAARAWTPSAGST